MRAVVQRVSEAWVRVDAAEVGRIGQGLLVLLGVGREDRDADADQLAEKVVKTRCSTGFWLEAKTRPRATAAMSAAGAPVMLSS